MASARQGWRLLIINATVGGIYALVGFAFLSVSHLGIVSPMWPPAGIAFAAAVRWRAKVVPGIVLGSMAANLSYLALKDSGADFILLTATVIGIGAALQAVVGAALARKYIERSPALRSARDIFLFLLFAGPVASVVNATIGTATQVASGVIPEQRAALAWLTWWAGDAMGIIVFGPITLMLLPDRRGIWQGWRLKVAVPSAIFAAVLMGAIMVSEDAANARLAAEREQATQDASALLLNQMDREQEVLQGIKALFLSSEPVGAKQFRTYTDDPLRRFASLKALSWNSVVKKDDLSSFVAARRQQPNSSDFTVTQRDATGAVEPVSDRERYVVVDYIEPAASNQAALGYDIASNPARALTIQRATVTGKMSGTPPIALVQSNGETQQGMLVLNPVYKSLKTPGTAQERIKDIRGFSVGVYQMTDMLNEVFGGQIDSGKWNDIGLELVDITDPENIVTLATRPAAESNANAPRILSDPMQINGRNWQLVLSPVSGPLAAPQAGASPYLLMVSVLGLYLLEALLLLLTGRERQAHSEAQERTYEANHDALTGLMNRRGFITRLEQLGAQSGAQGSGHVLLYGDLDRFKQVNDIAGHAAGDDMLVAVASIIRRHVRESDVVARIGGDEFAVILTDCPVDQGLKIANEIASAVAHFHLPTAKGELSVGISIGATQFRGDEDVDAVLHQADTAAYEIKLRGGDVRLYKSLEPVHAIDVRDPGRVR